MGTELCNTGIRKNVAVTQPSDADTQEIIKEFMGGRKWPCSQAEASVRADTLFGTGQAAATLSIGCEQMAAIVDAVYNTRKRVQCSISKRSVEVGSKSIVDQGIEIDQHPGSHIDCGAGGLHVGNLSTVTSVITSKLDSQTKQEVKDDLKMTMHTVLEQVQKSEKEAGTSPQAQSALSAAIKKIDEYFEGTRVDEEIDKVINEVMVRQTIKFVIRGTITGSHCRIGNESVVVMTANNVVKNVFDQAMDIKAVQDYVTTIKQLQTAKSTGLKGSSIYAIIGLIVALVVGYFGFRYLKKMRLI